MAALTNFVFGVTPLTRRNRTWRGWFGRSGTEFATWPQHIRRYQEDPMPTRTRRRVDINNATAEEIERACGIDGVLAERIVRYRDDHGPFTTREDIDQVLGFAEVRTDEVLSVVDLPSRRGGRGTRAGTTKRQPSTGTRASGPRQSGRRDASHAVPPPAGRSRTRSRSAEPTTDHDAIRAWVEERGGWP